MKIAIKILAGLILFLAGPVTQASPIYVWMDAIQAQTIIQGQVINRQFQRNRVVSALMPGLNNAPKSMSGNNPFDGVLVSGSTDLETHSPPRLDDNDGRTSIRVRWTVSGYRIMPDSSWNEGRARTMLFKPLEMDEKAISFGGRTCSNPNFMRKRVNIFDYLSAIHPDAPTLLSIPYQEATLIRTDCHIHGFAKFLRLPDKRLLIYMEGVFFFFRPNITY